MSYHAEKRRVINCPRKGNVRGNMFGGGVCLGRNVRIPCWRGNCCMQQCLTLSLCWWPCLSATLQENFDIAIVNLLSCTITCFPCVSDGFQLSYSYFICICILFVLLLSTSEIKR